MGKYKRSVQFINKDHRHQHRIHVLTPESRTAFETRMAELEAKADDSSDESFFQEEKPKANNRNISALYREESRTTQL